MLKVIKNYSFDPDSRTITLTGQKVTLSSLVSIENKEKGIYYYRQGDSSLALESLLYDSPDTILTLSSVLDISNHLDSDILSIVVLESLGLGIPESDYIGIVYTDINPTEIVYKVGGAEGAIVATLTCTYDENNKVTSITKG